MTYRWLSIPTLILSIFFILSLETKANTPILGQLTLELAADLNGTYISKLSGTPNTTQLHGTGQEITLTLQGEGLSTAKQIELFVAARPPEAFDIEASFFVPSTPYITIGSGVELIENNILRLGAVALQDVSLGDAELGILHLTIGPNYVPGSIASVQLLFLSIGPSSTERELYDEKITCLEWFLEPLNTAISTSPWGDFKASFR